MPPRNSDIIMTAIGLHDRHGVQGAIAKASAQPGALYRAVTHTLRAWQIRDAINLYTGAA